LFGGWFTKKIESVLAADGKRVFETGNQTRRDEVLGGVAKRGGGLGSRPKKMYGERLGDGVEYHLMSPTPRR